MATQQQYSLRWNDYTTHITGAFDALRYEEDLVDVTLFCEGRKIRAHKMLLSACSVYFKEIFKEIPCQHPVIVFKNVKYNDLHLLVEFMYLGEVSVLQDSLASFLQTAEMLSIRGLADASSFEQQLSSNITQGHPTSALAQQILQTQSQNMTSATITTAEPVFFTLPASSTIVPQMKMEAQPSAQQQYVNKIGLKNDIPSQVQLQQQQPQHQPQQRQQQMQTRQSQQHQRIQLKSGQTVAVTTIGPRTAIQEPPASQSEMANPPAATLNELVESVVSTTGAKKAKRVAKQKATTAIKQLSHDEPTPTTSYTTLSTANTVDHSNTDLEAYEQAAQEHEQGTAYSDSNNSSVKIHMTEFINVGDGGMNAASADSGNFTQQDNFELVNENIADHQESDEHMAPNSYEMEIVDMDVNGMFPEDGSEEMNKHRILQGAAKPKEEKKFKCKECEKSFATWKSLAMHRHIHSGRTKCDICGAVLSRTANLKRHMKLKHS